MSEKAPQSNSDSASFGNVPNDSESFGTVPNDAENFRSLRNVAEGKENHTLTVREVARMFETAGVARTERSIINWCQPNRLGVARLDCYFDPNDRKYFVTRETAELAIREEQAKMVRVGSEANSAGHAVDIDKVQSSFGNENDEENDEENEERIKSMERDIRNLEIANRVKDLHIEKLEEERERFGNERDGYVEKLIGFSRKVGELETQLLRIGGSATPSESIADRSPEPAADGRTEVRQILDP